MSTAQMQCAKRVVAAVLEVLNRYDLAGVSPGTRGGAPVDEYSNEARPIASRILNRGRIERAELSDIWRTWFGDDLRGLSDAAWSALLADLNATGRIEPRVEATCRENS